MKTLPEQHSEAIDFAPKIVKPAVKGKRHKRGHKAKLHERHIKGNHAKAILKPHHTKTSGKRKTKHH